MSQISVIQYSTHDGIEKFYMEATDLHSSLCSNELSWWKCSPRRSFNFPKTCRFRASLKGSWCEMAALGMCQQAPSHGGPGQVTKGAVVIVQSGAFLCPPSQAVGHDSWRMLARRPLELWGSSKPSWVLLKDTFLTVLGPPKDMTCASDSSFFLVRLWQKLWLNLHPYLSAEIKGPGACVGLSIFASTGLGEGW